MPTENAVPRQYRQVRISTVDDDLLLNRLEQFEETTRKEIAELQEEVRSLRELIRQLVNNHELEVSATNVQRKRRRILLDDTQDEDTGQGETDDDDNNEEQEAAAHEDANDVDQEVPSDADQEDVNQEDASDVDQENAAAHLSFGTDLFDGSMEINHEKDMPEEINGSSSYTGISVSDLPSDMFVSSPSQQQHTPPERRLDPNLTTVNDVWIEWKVGDNCIEKLIERYGDSWRHEDDHSLFLKRQVIIQEIEYIVKKCQNGDYDYETKCQKAIAALEARRQDRRGSLHRLSALIKAFQNNAEQAVGYDGTGEREAYVSIS
ncbi:hypothetical protein LRAMOSA01963 [Lichtheimia ramosa]|uniref:Transcription activator GCR1-like domain-containing protein n=1 Tax=Lichtheimia ramosa TaxID=688394 RepID=A0A077WLR7_9FUNG|nr:hypothetical protein LRAMOSA01963 [Lichtheimia ramosa]